MPSQPGCETQGPPLSQRGQACRQREVEVSGEGGVMSHLEGPCRHCTTPLGTVEADPRGGWMDPYGRGGGGAREEGRGPLCYV